MSIYTRSANGLQARVIRFTFGDIDVRAFQNYCPFFWLTVAALLFAPVAAVIKIVRAFGNGVAAVTGFVGVLVIGAVEWMAGVFPVFANAFSLVLYVVGWPAGWVLRHTVGPVLQRIYDLYSRDRFWNEERLSDLADKPETAIAVEKMLRAFKRSSSGSDCTAGVTERYLLTRVEAQAWSIIAKIQLTPWAAQEHERNKKHSEYPHWDPMNDEYWTYNYGDFTDGYQIRNLIKRLIEVTNSSDGYKMSAEELFIQQKTRTFQRLSVVFSPVIGMTAYCLAWIVGLKSLLVASGLVGGVVAVVFAALWSWPYVVATYKKICPPLKWTD